MLGACSQSFEDKLVGTWQCEPADQASDAPMTMTHSLTYTNDGKISGSLRIEEEVKDRLAVLRGTISGTWTYNGKSVVHTTSEEFQDLKIGEKQIPEDEVNPLVLARFQPKNTYDVTIAIDGDQLTWFEDPEKAKAVAKCERQS